MKKLYLFIPLMIWTFCIQAQTVTFSEDFENGIPTDWMQENNASSDGWSGGLVSQISSEFWSPDDNGSRVAASNDDGCGEGCDKSMDYLIMPAQDFSDGQGRYISFDAAFGGLSYQNATEVLTVEASVDGGATWSVIGTVTPHDDLSVNNHKFDLSSLTGASTQIAFHYNDGGGWTYGAYIDNVQIIVPEPLDAELTSLSFDAIAMTGSDISITGMISNLGSTEITSLELTWTGPDAMPHTDSLTGLSIPMLGTYEFTQTMPYNVVADANTITVEVSNVNGGGENVTTNNTMDMDVTGVPFIPAKGIVFEEATGTWCGWCPRGHVAMEYMENNYPGFLGVAVHNDDPMAVNYYDSGLTGVTGGGWPNGTADRNPSWSNIDPDLFESAYMDLQHDVPVAELNVTETSLIDNVLTVTVTADFIVPMTGDYRLGLILTENDVTGTGATYAQTNYYSFQSQNIALNGAGHDWRTQTNPVSASEMEYDHVARAIVGGFTGQAESLPTNLEVGTTYTYTFTRTISAAWNPEKMHLIATLHDNENSTTGQILNGLGADMPEAQFTPTKDLLLEDHTVKVFPNPASEMAYVRVDLENDSEDVGIEIFNVLGEQVYARQLNLSGDMIVPIHTDKFATGIYNVHVKVNGKFLTKKLVIE